MFVVYFVGFLFVFGDVGNVKGCGSFVVGDFGYEFGDCCFGFDFLCFFGDGC